jgi:adenosylcobinamide-phosphate synthase
MIGYKNRIFKDFGWATARVDDVLNWIPARLSALCIWAITGFPVKWQLIAQNARLHRSPNAGWPEAAMAYALEIRLSGPRSYEGQMQKFPWVNPIGRKNIGPSEIDNAIRILWATWVGVLALASKTFSYSILLFINAPTKHGRLNVTETLNATAFTGIYTGCLFNSCKRNLRWQF